MKKTWMKLIAVVTAISTLAIMGLSVSASTPIDHVQNGTGYQSGTTDIVTWFIDINTDCSWVYGEYTGSVTGPIFEQLTVDNQTQSITAMNWRYELHAYGWGSYGEVMFYDYN